MDKILLNALRLQKQDYSIDNIFQPQTYDWPGDWEGRALLAFCCHYEINGTLIPCMKQFMTEICSHLNEKLYFGKLYDGITVDEQQLSGHNWLMRGLLKYGKLFNDKKAYEIAESIFLYLYYPTIDHYKHYPLSPRKCGEVSGTIVADGDEGWRLSSDVGCSMLAIDGISAYYEYSGDSRAKEWLDTVLSVYSKADKYSSGFQSHATLSGARGALRLFEITHDETYFKIAKDTFDDYTERSMTLTYENFNWLNNPNTWTEPCAVVDSLILAIRIYKITGDKIYLTLARRIWFNGLDFCQRENGGVGPNTCTTINNPLLKVSMYEAPFCCTMRYAEGLLEYSQNRELFEWDNDLPEVTDQLGRHFVDDKLIVMYNGIKTPIFSCSSFSEEEAKNLELKIIY